MSAKPACYIAAMKPVRRNAAIDIPPGLDPEGAHPVKQERSRQHCPNG